MSLNTAVQHLATGIAPMIAGALLTKTADEKLIGFWKVGLVSAGTAAISIVLVGRLKPAAQNTPLPAPEVPIMTEDCPEGTISGAIPEPAAAV